MAPSISTSTALSAVLCCAGLFGSTVGASPDGGLVSRGANAVKDLRVMPLGASITFGWDSSTGNGYRAFLEKMLQDKGYTVRYVGTQRSGDMADNQVEAYPGFTISEIDEKALNSGAYDAKPNVVLLNAGTNDCQSFKYNPDGAPKAYVHLLDNVSKHCPGALIVASSLLPNLDDDADDCIRDLNPKLRHVAERAKSKGQDVVWVNMYDAVPRADMNTTDNTHPDDAGYKKMAQVWFDEVIKVASDIKNPAPVSSSRSNAPTSSASSPSSSPSTKSSAAIPHVRIPYFLTVITRIVRSSATL